MTAPVGPARLSSDDQGLLERFVQDIIVDDYGPPSGSAGPSEDRAPSWGNWAALVVAALIGVVVIVSLLNTVLSTDERQQTRDALIDRIAVTSADVQARQESVDQTRVTVDRLQRDVLGAASQQDAVSADDVARLGEAAATTPLAGPGVIVVVDDAPDAKAGSLNRVLDRDLQDIVNVLWRYGATGVAVNDQRLTSATAIRAAGEAILVNYQPLARPYRVSAVGTSTAGSGDSGLQSLLAGLSRDYGLVTEVTTGDVALPSGELRSPRFASTSPQGSSASADASPGVSSQ